jgi:hypothetical protein
MNCQRAEDLFIEYLYGELEPHQAESVRAHLDRCEACAARLAELARVRKLATAAAPDPEPSRRVINRVIARAREEVERPRSLWTFTWVKVLAPLCLAVVIGGLVAYQLRTGLAPRQMAYPPAGGERRQSAPTMEKEKKEIPAPARDKGKLALPAPPNAAKEPSSQRGEKAAPSPAPPLASPRPSAERANVKAAPPIEAERGKVLEAPGAPAADAGLSAPATRETSKPTAGRAQTAAPLSAQKNGPELSATGPGQAKGEAALRPRNLSSTEKVVTALGKKREESVLRLLRDGEEALKARRYGDAGQAFTRALELLPPGHPDRPRGLLGLARAEEGQRDLAAALRTYGELAKESPTHRELAEAKMRELSGAEVK